MIAKAREEKRMGKLAKALRKMSKKQRIPIPILENEISPQIKMEREARLNYC